MDRMIESSDRRDGAAGSDGGRVGRRWSRPLAVVAGLTLAASAGIASVSAQAQPQATPVVLPGEPGVPWDDGALAAEARSDLVNVHPRMWDHVLLAPDGRTATVYFWNGPAECTGFAGIEVAPAQVGFRVLVMTGDVPGVEACEDVALLYRAVVVLDDRVLGGGTIMDLPSGSRHGDGVAVLASDR